MASTSSSDGERPMVRRLLPAGSPADLDDFLAELAVGEPAFGATSPAPGTTHRPFLAVNMIATVDGRATVEGRTASLGNRADRDLFHGLRSLADAVMAGAGTVRAERYGRIVRDPATRERRAAAGKRDEPLAVVVSQSLDLAPDLPLLAEPEAEVVVLTGSDGELDPSAARVHYVRAPRDGGIDLDLALAELAERFDVASVLCEGGPRLNASLLRAGLVDELFLSIAPSIAGGTDELRIVHGVELSPPVAFELVSVLESESHLFLRYRVSAR